MRSVSNQYHISLRWQFRNVSSQRYKRNYDILYYLICDRNGLTSSTALKMAAAASASATLRFAAATGC